MMDHVPMSHTFRTTTLPAALAGPTPGASAGTRVTTVILPCSALAELDRAALRHLESTRPRPSLRACGMHPLDPVPDHLPPDW